MDAVKFIKERQRFCDQAGFCTTCELRRAKIFCGTFNAIKEPKELVEFIEKWSKSHPIVTNGMKFVEVFGIQNGTKKLWEENKTKFWEEIGTWWDSEYKKPEDK